MIIYICPEKLMQPLLYQWFSNQVSFLLQQIQRNIITLIALTHSQIIKCEYTKLFKVIHSLKKKKNLGGKRQKVNLKLLKFNIQVLVSRHILLWIIYKLIKIAKVAHFWWIQMGLCIDSPPGRTVLIWP